MVGSNSLPPGWRVTNSSGCHAGPSIPPESTDFNDRDDSDTEPAAFDIRPDSPGWEDMEDDDEPLSVKDFFSDRCFSSAQAMLEHAKVEHGFDFMALCKSSHLDFYGAIRLVNYIRKHTQQNQSVPDVSEPALWADEIYLQPVLEDDALLFCLGDLVEFENDGQEPVDFDDRAAQQAAKEQHTDLDQIEECEA